MTGFTDQQMLERWMSAKGIQQVYSDEARAYILENSGFKPYKSDHWIQRINLAKEEAIRTSSPVPVDKLFSGIMEYMNPTKLNATEQAKHEENALRFYKIWFKHYDDWYVEFLAKLNKCPPTCPEDCPNHIQLKLLEEEDFAF